MNTLKKEIFITIMDDTILKYYNNSFIKKYKRKYTIKYYLNLIFELINDINTWSALQKLNIYKPINKNNNTIPNYHWKTIMNLYNKWCKDNIFIIAFENYNNDKTIIMKQIDLYID